VQPTWTDIGTFILTLVGVLGGLGLLGVAAYQLLLQTRELRVQTKLNEAGRALDLMRQLALVNSTAVTYPELVPYFEFGAEPPNNGSDEALRVIAHANGFISLGEATGWQIRTEQMGWSAAFAWRDYFTKLIERSPAVGDAVERNHDLLAAESNWLFGDATATSPVLERLAAAERRAAEGLPDST
jgi:hypothetical protein